MENSEVSEMEKKKHKITKPRFLKDLQNFGEFGGEEGYSEDDFESMAQLYEKTLENIDEGEVVKGTVLKITKDEVFLDIGYKSEGSVPLYSFSEDGTSATLKPGDEVEVFLEQKEDADGLVVLSREKAKRIKVWERISEAFEKDEVLEGRVIKKIKGGLTVDIGIPAFLPGSQVDLRPVKDLGKFVGETIRIKVIKLNKKRGNIVLSRRVLLELDRNMKKQKTLENLKEGNVVKGVVKNITDYGIFVDLGGIDGLLHVTDMSWGRIRHPSEKFSLGDKAEVVILKFDQENEKVSLGIKQLTQDPWELAEEKYAPGTKVNGKVVSLTDYGAFMELENGVEGLIHVSEMSWTNKIRHPSQVVTLNEDVEAIVIDLNKDSKRISLGMKQIKPNPWELVEERYEVGHKITGRVRNLADFGAFVELEEGIDGLIHISDMSWTQRINHPGEILKKGDTVEVVVLKIDAKNERLSLGLKQLKPDPWKEVLEKYQVGNKFERKVLRVTDFGAFIEIENGIEGLIHISEFGDKKDIKSDEMVWSKIIRIDTEARKIGLSINKYNEDKEKEVIKEYTTSSQTEAVEPFQSVLSQADGEKLAEMPGRVEEKSVKEEEKKEEDLSSTTETE